VITVVHNSEMSPPGRLVPALERGGQIVNHVLAHRGERLPFSPSAVVVLGGEMSAFDAAAPPFLHTEKRWIAQLVEAGTPVLAICLGAQLLADALGGRAFRADEPELGVIDIVHTGEGKADPVVGPLVPPVLAVHEDSFELPPDAVLLAHSDRFPHAFRVGSAIGLQFHPETVADIAIGWARSGLSDLFAAAGVSFDQFSTELVAHDQHLTAEAASLFARWLGSALA
jgi:GMP synthase (glutamine-hydrolysing)